MLSSCHISIPKANFSTSPKKAKDHMRKPRQKDKNSGQFWSETRVQLYVLNFRKWHIPEYFKTKISVVWQRLPSCAHWLYNTHEFCLQNSGHCQHYHPLSSNVWCFQRTPQVDSAPTVLVLSLKGHLWNPQKCHIAIGEEFHPCSKSHLAREKGRDALHVLRLYVWIEEIKAKGGSIVSLERGSVCVWTG